MTGWALPWWELGVLEEHVEKARALVAAERQRLAEEAPEAERAAEERTGRLSRGENLGRHDLADHGHPYNLVLSRGVTTMVPMSASRFNTT